MSYAERLSKQIKQALQGGSHLLSSKIDIDILKNHAFLEFLMELGLKLSINSGEPDTLTKTNKALDSVLAQLSFPQKVRILQKLDKLDKESSERLLKFNDLRNAHAHSSIGRTLPQFSAEQTNSLMESLINAIVASVSVEYIKREARHDALLGVITGNPSPQITTTVAGERTPDSEPPIKPEFKIQETPNK